MLSSVYTKKYKWQVACSTVSHEKALHNYFIPCPNLRKLMEILGRARKNIREFPKTSEYNVVQPTVWPKSDD